MRTSASVSTISNDPASVMAGGLPCLGAAARQRRDLTDRPIRERVDSRLWLRSAKDQGGEGRVRSCAADEKPTYAGPGGRSPSQRVPTPPGYRRRPSLFPAG